MPPRSTYCEAVKTVVTFSAAAYGNHRPVWGCTELSCCDGLAVFQAAQALHRLMDGTPVFVCARTLVDVRVHELCTMGSRRQV